MCRMAMGKRKRERQPTMWVTTTDLPTAVSHPFYARLNRLLREHGFDDFAEAVLAQKLIQAPIERMACGRRQSRRRYHIAGSDPTCVCPSP